MKFTKVPITILPGHSDIPTNLPDWFKPYYTNEMYMWFKERTKKHINTVLTFSNNLSYELEEHIGNKLLIQCRNHDASKLELPIEKWPYVLITWKYKIGENEFNKLGIPEEIQTKMLKATEQHCKNNLHHPEYWDESLHSGFVNPVDRDKPGKQTDGRKMDIVSLLEMCCDWAAVSVERNSSLKNWYTTNLGNRWIFTSDQTRIIKRACDILIRYM